MEMRTMVRWTPMPTKKQIEENVGFVYKITHTDSGMYYIGQKRFHKKLTRKPLKGNTRRRIDFKESDWQSYWGSSNAFISFVHSRNQQGFTKQILHICPSQFELTYREMKEQLAHDVFNDPYSFNMIINVRLMKNKIAEINNKVKEYEASKTN